MFSNTISTRTSTSDRAPRTPDRTVAQVDTKAARRAGLAGEILTGIVLAFLVFDVAGKFLQPDVVVEATLGLGFSRGFVPVIGVLLAVGVVLCANPRTAFVGAAWITAYMGGAVCANILNEQPLFTVVLAPVYTAGLVWLSLYLRSPRLRELVRSGI